MQSLVEQTTYYTSFLASYDEVKNEYKSIKGALDSDTEKIKALFPIIETTLSKYQRDSA